MKLPLFLNKKLYNYNINESNNIYIYIFYKKVLYNYKKRKGNITKQDKTTLNKKMIMLIGAFRTIINNQFKKNFNINFIRNK